MCVGLKTSFEMEYFWAHCTIREAPAPRWDFAVPGLRVATEGDCSPNTPYLAVDRSDAKGGQGFYLRSADGSSHTIYHVCKSELVQE